MVIVHIQTNLKAAEAKIAAAVQIVTTLPSIFVLKVEYTVNRRFVSLLH